MSIEKVETVEKKQWDLLLKWLESNDISQRAFAQELEVTEGAVNHWINGRWSPQLENLRAISLRTGYGIDRLVKSLPIQPETTA
jgi:transcriptional regulator with XRE-family HTH domain